MHSVFKALKKDSIGTLSTQLPLYEQLRLILLCFNNKPYCVPIKCVP